MVGPHPEKNGLWTILIVYLTAESKTKSPYGRRVKLSQYFWGGVGGATMKRVEEIRYPSICMVSGRKHNRASIRSLCRTAPAPGAPIQNYFQQARSELLRRRQTCGLPAVWFLVLLDRGVGIVAGIFPAWCKGIFFRMVKDNPIERFTLLKI